MMHDVRLGDPHFPHGYWRIYVAIQTHIKTMENHHFEWENSLSLWPFPVAMLKLPEVTSYPIYIHFCPGSQLRLAKKHN